MGDLKFILGFLSGWIATTKEGKKAATYVAESTASFVKENFLKKNEKAE